MLNGQKWLRGTNNSNRYYFVDQLLQYKIARRSTLLFDLFSPPILCWQTQVPGGACLAKTQQAVHSFQINSSIILLCFPLSSARARRASAESAWAVTGKRCPHSGKGEDFLTGQLNIFTKTAVTPERKVKKSIPRWEINRHAEG